MGQRCTSAAKLTVSSPSAHALGTVNLGDGPTRGETNLLRVGGVDEVLDVPLARGALLSHQGSQILVGYLGGSQVGRGGVVNGKVAAELPTCP